MVVAFSFIRASTSAFWRLKSGFFGCFLIPSPILFNSSTKSFADCSELFNLFSAFVTLRPDSDSLRISAPMLVIILSCKIPIFKAYCALFGSNSVNSFNPANASSVFPASNKILTRSALKEFLFIGNATIPRSKTESALSPFFS